MPGKIATAEEWRAARLALFEKEKESACLVDAIKADRRALPMVPVTKAYNLQGPDGPVTLKDLFGTKSQLIVYHFMFEPTADDGCQGCAFMAANFPDLRHLADKDTAMIAVSRAPIEKITPYKEKNFWKFPWVSSHGTDFNYDFHVTLNERVAPAEYSFLNKEELEAAERRGGMSGEQPGLTVFKLEDGQVYHTYSAYFRLDELTSTYAFLDLTPAGRQEGSNGPAGFKTPAEYAEEGKKGGK
ncbi:hypothetical protein OIDMADRAFT_31119 [Oidiodendron maius Zn]|uniref:Thioredoxin domain-containing protein n=1 Tax=Oidiodendron maius (strain Zn) TaxID=913774 RepID=A0A0C3H4M1_OIDMZ|nr:hypothetical protein OIDMADRAFT_31119 [Oidiodendron maius Zn]